MQIRIEVSLSCLSEEAAPSPSASEIIRLKAYAQRSWRVGISSPDDEGIMLAL